MTVYLLSTALIERVIKIKFKLRVNVLNCLIVLRYIAIKLQLTTLNYTLQFILNG